MSGPCPSQSQPPVSPGIRSRSDRIYKGLSYQRYERRQLKNISPILRCVARHCTTALKYPILRILRSVARRFMLNEIEALFLVYLIRETGWAVNDRVIVENCEGVRGVVGFVKEEPEYHRLVLYLLLLTFSVKECLNEDNPFLPTALKICPNFETVFEEWAQRHSATTRQINPRTINQLHQLCQGRLAEEEQDYVAMVDEIIKLSPAYSFTRCAEERLRAEEVRQDDHVQEFWRARPEKRKRELELQTEPLATFAQGGLVEIAQAGLTNDSQLFRFQSDRIDQLGFEHSGVAQRRGPPLGQPDLVSHSEEQFCEQSSLAIDASGEHIVFRNSQPFGMNWDQDDYLEFINQ